MYGQPSGSAPSGANQFDPSGKYKIKNSGQDPPTPPISAQQTTRWAGWLRNVLLGCSVMRNVVILDVNWHGASPTLKPAIDGHREKPAIGVGVWGGSQCTAVDSHLHCADKEAGFKRRGV